MRSPTPLLVAGLVTLRIATTASADSCIGPTLDIPFPTASGVKTQRADVPSPRFPGLWQEGIVQGYAYRLFANGDATLEPLPPEDGWRLLMSCDLVIGACYREETGSSPENATYLATALENCFVNPNAVTAQALIPPQQKSAAQPPTYAELSPKPAATSGTIPEVPVSEDAALQSGALVAPLADDTPVRVPDPVNTNGSLPRLLPQNQKEALPNPVEQSRQDEEPESALQTTAIPTSCGLDILPKGASSTLMLQRMLLEAGVNPGPLDGLVGPRTRNALRQVLGNDANYLSPEEAIKALKLVLCTRGS